VRNKELREQRTRVRRGTEEEIREEAKGEE